MYSDLSLGIKNSLVNMLLTRSLNIKSLFNRTKDAIHWNKIIVRADNDVKIKS